MNSAVTATPIPGRHAHTTLATVTRRPARPVHWLAIAALAIILAVTATGTISAHAVATATRTAQTAPQGSAAALTATSALPLKGKIVGIDPGHNGLNKDYPAYLAKQVWNGREWEGCDTTGTQTDAAHPFTEALFNWHVASYLKADLLKDGAKVVMTRPSNSGHGPCVDKRSFIINNAHANVAVDIHADGAYCAGCRGFALLEPVADGPNDKVIHSSRTLGADIKAAMLALKRMPVSNYDGTKGISYRDDLAGLNLTKVPKILIEVGNMKNATDARLLGSPTFQQQVARALLNAIIKFLK
jgi:N-acetylmuramoyl-L-alanine amidase